MRRLLIRAAFCAAIACAAFAASAAEGGRVYRGTVGERPVTLYLFEDMQQCTGDAVFRGMYRYDGKSDWLQLDISANDKRQFAMVEHDVTGVLMLKESADAMNGQWLSPDQARTLPVKLKRKTSTGKEIQSLDKQYEELNYRNNDC